MQRCSSTNNPVDVRLRRSSHSRGRGMHRMGSEKTAMTRSRSSSNRSCASGSSASTTVSNIIAQMMIISQSRSRTPASAIDPPSRAEVEATELFQRARSLSRDGRRMLASPTPPPPPPKPKLTHPAVRRRSISRPPSQRHDRFQEQKNVILPPDPPYRLEKPQFSDRVEKSLVGSHNLRHAPSHQQSRPTRQHQRDDTHAYPVPPRGRSKEPLARDATNNRLRSKSHHKGKRRSLSIDDLEAEDALVLFDDSDQEIQSVKPPLSNKTYPPTSKKYTTSKESRSRSKSTERHSSPSMNHRRDVLRRQATNEKDDSYLANKATSKSKRDGKMRGRGRSVSRDHTNFEVTNRRSVSKSRDKHVVSSSRSRRSKTPSSHRPPPPESKFDSTDRREKHTSAMRAKKSTVTGKGLDLGREKSSPLRKEKFTSDVSVENIKSQRIRTKRHGHEKKYSRGDSSTNSMETMSPESTSQPSTHVQPDNNMQTARVLNMPYTTPLGEFGWYSGDVNEFGKPHGQGTLRSTAGQTTQAIVWYHGYPRANLGKLLSPKEKRRDASLRTEYKHTR
ncbi:hypothetical protein ACHAWX_003191 [Stephanocyclus meneghinianus]